MNKNRLNMKEIAMMLQEGTKKVFESESGSLTAKSRTQIHKRCNNRFFCNFLCRV